MSKTEKATEKTKLTVTIDAKAGQDSPARSIFWEPEAWNNYVELQDDEQMLERINGLIDGIRRNPCNYSFGKPEVLKHDLSGLASIEIDQNNKLVFKVDDEKITIIECGTHYQAH